MVTVVKRYRADDGKEFDTREEAVAHDAATGFDALIGLTEEDIADVLAGKNPELGEALERIAARASRIRRAAGILKRKPKPKDTHAEPPKEPEAKEAA